MNHIREVLDKYEKRIPRLTVKTFEEQGDVLQTYVLLEGDKDALRFLGEVILAFVDSEAGCNWDIHPKGPGNIYFEAGSTLGIYLHALPCDLHPDNKVR